MFTKDDLVNYKMFKTIINNGGFEIKGNAVIQTALLFDWFNKVEEKIELALKETAKKGAPKITKIGE